MIDVKVSPACASKCILGTASNTNSSTCFTSYSIPKLSKCFCKSFILVLYFLATLVPLKDNEPPAEPLKKLLNSSSSKLKFCCCFIRLSTSTNSSLFLLPTDLAID